MIGFVSKFMLCAQLKMRVLDRNGRFKMKMFLRTRINKTNSMIIHIHGFKNHLKINKKSSTKIWVKISSCCRWQYDSQIRRKSNRGGGRGKGERIILKSI